MSSSSRPQLDSLIISYSGVRGILGKSLTSEVALRFGTAFRQLLPSSLQKPLIVLARDARPSGDWLLPQVMVGICSQPAEVLYLGIVPTPTVQVMMKKLNADGGIVVTASHNPPEWNGFKFLLGPHAIVADGDQTRRLFELYQAAKGESATQAPVLPPDHGQEAIDAHLQIVLSHVNVDAIRAKKLRVALDSGAGTGERLAPALLEALGCEVTQVEIERESEPTAKNLAGFAAVIKNGSFDIGLAQDMDADRLALVDETGEPVGEEYSLSVAVQRLLERQNQLKLESKPVVVKNTSTSQVIDDLVKAFGTELREVRVGEVNLSKAFVKIEEEGLVGFGGEGNGGIIYPPVCYGRDSHIGMALVLEHLAVHNMPLSQIVAKMPRYFMIKHKVECADETHIKQLLTKAEQVYCDGTVDHPDGIKIRFADGAWCQVRPSNTEPIVRIIAEAKSLQRAEELVGRLS